MDDPVPMIVATFAEAAAVVVWGLAHPSVKEAYDELRARLAEEAATVVLLEAVEKNPSSAAKRDALTRAVSETRVPEAIQAMAAVARLLFERLVAARRPGAGPVRAAQDVSVSELWAAQELGAGPARAARRISLFELVDAMADGAAAVAEPHHAAPSATWAAYVALRSLLIARPGLLEAVEAAERWPGSDAGRTALAEALEGWSAAADPDLADAVHRLRRILHAVQADSLRRRHIQDLYIRDLFEEPFGHSGSIPPTRLKALPPKRLDDPVKVKATWAERAEGAEYVVWYATNRRPTDPTDPDKGYTAERDATIRYGDCRVLVPKSHKIGSTGSPWWKRLFTGDDRLKLHGIAARRATDYWLGVAAQIGAADPGERHALVFIHGYNVSFEQAALRAAQIGFDLQVRGAMAFFSWPSRGRLDGYLADAATIEASEGQITDFLVDFADRSGAQAVHLIAHSMGNRGVLRAVDRIAQRARRRSNKKRFGQIILAAADVDADLFRQRCAAYVDLARRTTLYVSTRDLAVEASHWLHDFPRVGLMPPVCVAPGIDTVNVANVDLTRLGHGYVAEARAVLQDMHDLLARGAPPDQRFGLRPADAPEGGRFWVIGA